MNAEAQDDDDEDMEDAQDDIADEPVLPSFAGNRINQPAARSAVERDEPEQARPIAQNENLNDNNNADL